MKSVATAMITTWLLASAQSVAWADFITYSVDLQSPNDLFTLRGTVDDDPASSPNVILSNVTLQLFDAANPDGVTLQYLDSPGNWYWAVSGGNLFFVAADIGENAAGLAQFYDPANSEINVTFFGVLPGPGQEGSQAWHDGSIYDSQSIAAGAPGQLFGTPMTVPEPSSYLLSITGLALTLIAAAAGRMFRRLGFFFRAAQG